MMDSRISNIREALICCIGKECDGCPYSGRMYCEDAVREDAAEALAELEMANERLAREAGKKK